MVVSAKCNCGNVKVTINKLSEMTILCRCNACRTAGGSLHSANLMVSKEDVTIEGKMKTFEYEAISGARHLRYFCPECGAPIQTTNDSFPLTFVKAGLFPKGVIPPVRQVLFEQNKEDWDTALYEGAEVKQQQ